MHGRQLRKQVKWVTEKTSLLFQIEMVDNSVDLLSLLEAVQGSWEQPQKSPNRKLDMEILSAYASQFIEVLDRICAQTW